MTTQVITRQAIKVTHTDGRVEILTEQNYPGFNEWAHDLTIQGKITGEKTGAIYELTTISSEPQQITKEKQMSTTEVSKNQFPGDSFMRVIDKAHKEASAIRLAAQESETLDIIENLLLNLPHDTSLTDDLVLTIQAYIASEGKDGNKSHDELGQLAGKAKLWGVFKLCGQVKGSDAFQALVAKHTPEIIVSGGNQMGTVVSVGTTAKEVVEAPKPSKGGKKSTKAPKAKKEKAAKVLPPMPTIADLAQLEAMGRKELQSAMSAVNQHMTTGVKGNGKTDDILKALAKHVLGIDNYTPVAKPKSSTGSKAPKELIALDMPTDLQWSEVKNMKFRELQGLAKIFRSHGLYSGNLAGKGVTKDFLLTSIKEILRGMGHEIIEANMSAPSELKPTLERHGVSKDLERKATSLIKGIGALAAVA